MVKTNRVKKVGMRRLLFLIGCSGSLMAFQNCGASNFSTGDIENPSVASVVPAPPDETRNDIAEIAIPEQPYEKLSQSPFFNLADKIAADALTYANLKLYTPQYPLYSDGASKRRWIFLPEGTSIDTTSPDEWIFPQGAILYKEFSVNGKKVETRVFEKVGNQTGFSAWRASVYVWLTDQTDADLLKVDNFYSQTAGEMALYQANEVAGQYKMVNLSQCLTCHGSARDVSRGFSYLQLSDTSKTMNIFSLGNLGYFTNQFNQIDIIPGTSKERAAIGYIQSNCATCHGGTGPGPHNFKHLSTSRTLADEPLIKSIGASSGLVTFGNPQASRLYNRMSNGTMPRVTLYTKDSIGLQTLNDWITDSVMP